MNLGRIDSTEGQPLPTSVEWIPAGTHHVFPMGAGKDGITITATPQDAERLDAQLQIARAEADAGKRSRLFVDFNHEGKEAAAIPVRFFWDNGIRLEVEWTAAGAAAIAGRVFSYFSPEFYPSKDGHPEAIPLVGALGSLVNTPAFQTIERLAAAMDTSSQNMKNILAALGLPEDATEQQAVDAIAGLKTAQSSVKASLDAEAATVATLRAELDTTKAERETLATEAGTLKAELQKRDARDAVSAAIAAGKITEASREKFEAMHIADAKNFADVIAAIVPRSGNQPVQAESVEHGNSDARIYAEYQALKGEAKTKFYAQHADAIWRAATAS